MSLLSRFLSQRQLNFVTKAKANASGCFEKLKRVARAKGVTNYTHVILNGDNVPVIAGINMKVIELVLGRMAYGWSPEELHFQHPYLTLGQIYSALAYYWDH